MAIVYIPVEVPDEEVVRLSGLSVQPVTERNHPSSQPSQGAERSEFQQQGDPWQNGGGQQNQGGQQYQNNQNQGQYRGQQTNQGYQNNQQYQNQGQQQQGGRNCAHGPMTWTPPGINRSTGEQYNGYFRCPLERGTQGRCKNVYV